MANRSIETAIWNDDFIAEKKPLDRLLYVYLLTNDKTRICGFYKITPATISAETGMSRKQIEESLERLFPKVIYLEGYIAIKNYQEYQTGGGDKIEAAVKSQLNRVPSAVQDRVSQEWDRVSATPDTPIVNTNTRVNTKASPSDHPERSLSFLEEVPEPQLTALAEKYHLHPHGVQSKATDLFLYCQSKGRKYQNYQATLENALRKDADKLRVKYPPAPKPKAPEPEIEQTEEQKARAAELLQEAGRIARGMRVVHEQTV